MIKKIGAFMFALVLTSSVGLSSNVFAIDSTDSSISPVDTPAFSYTSSCNVALSISGSTATCDSYAIGYYNETTKIEIKQTLQKKSSTNTWSNVNNASWTKTINSFQGSLTSTKSSLSSGTYRIKSEFTVYAGTNYENITAYSKEKTV